MRARHRHFNPRDSGAIVVLDARFINGLSDSDAVSTWVDRSGNENSASQSTTTNKPLYKIGIQGGNPVVRFDGLNHYMTISALVISQPMTFLLTGKAADDDEFQYFFDGTTSSRMALIKYANRNLVLFAGVELQDAHTWGVHQIFSGIFNGSSSLVNVNGEQVLTGQAGSSGVVGFKVGARYSDQFFLNGDISSLVFFNTLIALPLRKRIERSSGISFKIFCN